MLARWTVVDADAAAQEFESAIELDPGFAAAYASLYDARLMAEDRRSGRASADQARSGNADIERSLSGARAKNQALIDKALTLDPMAGAAYFARAIWADDASGKREADFRRGVELDPSNGRGLTAFAEFLYRSDRDDEAERMLQRAIAIDPLAPRGYFVRAMQLLTDGPEVHEASMLKVLEIDPDYVPALQRYAKYRWMFHGEQAEAIQLIERALALDPTNPWILHTAIAMYLDVGDADAARALLAGAERPEVTGRLLIMFYDGNSRGAGEAAFEESAFAAGNYENWGVYEALRDWALASGDYERVLAQIERYTALAGENAQVTLKNFRAVPAFAQVEMANGDSRAARALLEKCIRWIDEVHLPQFGNVYALRTKANALMLLGETGLAVETLQDSFSALDYLQWWYTLDRDPLWMPLHGDRRFAAIAGAVREHAAGQAAKLDVLRQQGLVPQRTLAVAPALFSDDHPTH